MFNIKTLEELLQEEQEIQRPLELEREQKRNEYIYDRVVNQYLDIVDYMITRDKKFWRNFALVCGKFETFEEMGDYKLTKREMFIFWKWIAEKLSPKGYTLNIGNQNEQFPLTERSFLQESSLGYQSFIYHMNIRFIYIDVDIRPPPVYPNPPGIDPVPTIEEQTLLDDIDKLLDEKQRVFVTLDSMAKNVMTQRQERADDFIQKVKNRIEQDSYTVTNGLILLDENDVLSETEENPPVRIFIEFTKFTKSEWKYIQTELHNFYENRYMFYVDDHSLLYRLV